MRHRLTISIDADLHDELTRVVQRGSMSAWFEAAARDRLDRIRRGRLADAAAAVDPDDELDDLAALTGRTAPAGALRWASLRSPEGER